MLYSSIIKKIGIFAFEFYYNWVSENYREDIIYPFGIRVLIPATIFKASLMMCENKSFRRKDTL